MVLGSVGYDAGGLTKQTKLVCGFNSPENKIKMHNKKGNLIIIIICRDVM